uniref:Uncharacterized protein n=1 Tax=Hordeum vulgare subsp. vulgare TaxID=112509 RepID=A0A8I6YAH0_HORVV
MAPISAIGIKRSAPSDHDEQLSYRCKGASLHQAQQRNFKGKQIVNHEDHGGDEARESTRRRHLSIDINEVPHKQDDDHDNPHPIAPPAEDGMCSNPPYWLLSLVNKKKALENEILEVAEKRLRWATEDLMEEMELKKMRLQNEKMRLQNYRLSLQVKRKELELSVVKTKRT